MLTFVCSVHLHTHVCKSPSGAAVYRGLVTRRVEPKHLVGAAEIAERLGLRQPHTVHSWRRRYPDFPEPIAQLKTALIWYWPDVEKWAKATGRA